MKFSLAALSLIPFVSASRPMIAGYEPGSSVTDHNAIDLDQKAFEGQLGLATADSFAKAKQIYNEGGHSKSFATIELTTGLASELTKDSGLTGESVSIGDVKGKMYSSAPIGSTTIKFKYTPSEDNQEEHVKCKVGALPVADQIHDGCLEATGSITVDGTGASYSYSYSVENDNKNGRSIAGFSTSAASKMLEGCPGCPYAEFKKYYDYYGQADYAHAWVTAALDGTKTNFKNGNADFAKYGYTGRTEAAKKGTAYMNVYMYVIREFEDAIDDCNKGCLECNFGSVHAWDEGVAFYTGSLEGVTGAGSGKLIHALADKRCQNYKTCGIEGDELEGQSYVNYQLFQKFLIGQQYLVTGTCDALRNVVDDISDLMSVPLVQGTLRYAYKVDKLKGAEKEKAEGAVFAAAVLPRVASCSADDAKIVYDNMMVDASSTDHAAVKSAFERNYDCMGMNGKLVGGLWNGATGSYYENAAPKKDKSTGGVNKLAMGLGIGFGIAGLVGIAFIATLIRKEKQGKPIFTNASNDAIDV